MVLIACSIILSVIFVYAGNGIVHTVASFLDERAETEKMESVPQRYK